MSFIAAAVIGSVGVVAGASIAGKDAKKAAGVAAEGSEKEIEFNRESRDLIRQDQAPYREAGYTALDALMSLTGLPTGKASKTSSVAPRVRDTRFDVMNDERNLMRRRSSYGRPRTHPRYDGGSMQPDTVYNVAEVAPENVFSKGRVTRPNRPVTIDGTTGYVEPNIEGRAEGGIIGGMYDNRKITPPWGGSNPRRRTKDIPRNYTRNEPRTTPPKQRTPSTIDPRTGYPNENPGGTEGGYNFQTDPGYEFRYSEGMRGIDRSAASKGHALSGGQIRRAIRYGQDYASGEYTNVYNRIAAIAGIGQTANQYTGNAALTAGANMGRAASDAGYSRASGYAAAGNVWANATNQIAQLPWGNVFNKGAPTPTAPIGRGN